MVRRLNKGYISSAGAITNIIEKEKNLVTKLKIIKWLKKALKYEPLKNFFNDMHRKVLSSYINQTFFKLLQQDKICEFSSKINSVVLKYDSLYDRLFIKPSYFSDEKSADHQCAKNVYVMDQIIQESYEPSEKPYLVYTYRNGVYLYFDGEVKKTRYKSISRFVYSKDSKNYAFLFEDKKGKGFNVNGKEYRLKKEKCEDIYISVNSSFWALQCRSKKYINKRYLKFANLKKFPLFTYILRVMIYKDNVLFVSKNGNMIYFYLNNTFLRRFRIDEFSGYNIIAQPFDEQGSRWIYGFYSWGRRKAIIMDSKNIIPPQVVESSQAYIITPQYELYTYKIVNNKYRIFRNGKLLLREEVGEIPGANNPWNYTTSSAFFVYNAEFKCVIFVYTNNQLNHLNVLIIGKKRKKKYTFKGATFKPAPRDRLLLNIRRNNTNFRACFKMALKYKLIKAPGECALQLSTQNLEYSLTYKHDKTLLIFGSHKRTLRQRNLTFSALYLRKKVFILFGRASNTYIPPVTPFFGPFGLSGSKLIVSLKNNLDFDFSFLDSHIFYYDSYKQQIFFIYENSLYRLFLDQWVDKFLYPLSITCSMQKRLCQ
ncbi:MAG: hypothetical protein ACK4NF_00535 [Planctomycetota bacterium]